MPYQITRKRGRIRIALVVVSTLVVVYGKAWGYL